MNDDYRSDPETYAILGAAMEVHRRLGCGYLEAVYHDALAIELAEAGIPFVREYAIPITYKGQILGTPYRADFVCHGSVIVELKAMKTFGDIEVAQVLHYLKATGYKRALLINFGTSSLKYKRLIRTDESVVPSTASLEGAFSDA